MAQKWMVYIARRWRLPKLIWVLLILEIPLSIAALALFGIADPDTYRTKLWQNGSNQGFNSDPSSILYEYANYETVHTPLIWSNFMTQFNVVCAVLSTFILIVKSTMFVLHGFLPVLSLFTHAVLVALYAVAVRNQASPDLSHPEDVRDQQKNLPWYLSKGCGYASDSNYGYCMQARASFGITITMVVLFAIYFFASIHSSIITKEEKAIRQADYDEDIEMEQYEKDMDPYQDLSKEERWEQNRQMFLNMPKTPNTPSHLPLTTPRTTAFNQLSGGSGEPSAVGRTETASSGPSRKFPLRMYDEIKRDII